MRVGLVIDSLARGGAEGQALAIARELARRGCQVQLIHYHRVAEAHDARLADGAEVVCLPKRGTYLRFIGRLAAHLRRGRFDVVHSFKHTACVYATVAASIARVPVIFGAYRVEYQDAGLLRMLHRLVDRRITGWIENSQAGVEALVRGIGTDRRKCHVVYNGIDLEDFVARRGRAEVRAELGLPPAATLVSLVARLRPQKNHEMFLQVARKVTQQHPEAHFVAIGGGPLQAALLQQRRRLGLEAQVSFVGDRSDVADLLGASDICVLTSHYEGLANALIEAMALGLPVVTTDYAGVDEVVAHEVEGFVVPRGDVDEMTRRLCALVQDAGLRRRLGAHGRTRVGRQFSSEVMGERLLSVYRLSLARAGGRA